MPPERPSSSFFFCSRRRHTRSLCDWSSDVCSSDLSIRELPFEHGGSCYSTQRSEFLFTRIGSSGSSRIDNCTLEYNCKLGNDSKHGWFPEWKTRSEERRVGKESKIRGSPDHSTQR